MKKIIIAAMSLSLLTGSVVFAQDTTSTMKMKKHKKAKKSTSTDTMSAPK